MNTLIAALRALVDDLRVLKIDWCLVGGMAVSVRAEPRFTRDVEVAVAVKDDTEAERLCFDLTGRGYRVVATVEHEARHRLATGRLTRTRDDALIVVDLLFASSGIEAEVVRDASLLEIVAGLTLPVASTAHLIALKTLSRDDDRRPQDLQDLRALLAHATPLDLDAAHEALAQVEQRGFNRGRDLQAALRGVVANAPKET